MQSAFSQDKLYKKSGEVQSVKVKEIGVKTISYKRFDNQEGPDYVINRTEVERIVFQNGVEEWISEKPREEKPAEPKVQPQQPQQTPVEPQVQQQQPIQPQQNVQPAQPVRKGFGSNILALAPIQMTNASVMGFGLHYERMLDPKGIITAYLPMAFSVVSKRAYVSNSNGYGSYETEYGSFFWFYPGLKVYPGGNKHIVNYGVGPSLAMGWGTVPVTYSDFNGRTKFRSEDRSYFGMMINNSLTIQPTSSLVVGGELGLGIPYNIYRNDGDSDYRNVPLVQFKFFLGVRF